MPKGPIDGDQVYEAERLLDKRIQNGQVQYFIKWKGWPNKFNTWEPEENILDKTLVTMYEHYQSLDMGPSSTNRTKRKTTPDTSPIKLRKRSVEDLDSSSPSKLRRSIRSNKSSKNLNENVDEEEDEYSEKKNKKKKGIQKIQSSPLSLPSGANLEAQNFATTSDNNEEVDKEQDTNESAENASTADESEKSSDKPKKKMSPREINELKNQPKPNNIELETSTEELTETSAEDEIITEVTTNDILSENDDNDLITAPVEIYVEKKIEEVTSTDGSTKKDIYIITNADDPNCTHKIQVHSIPRKKNNTSSETINDEEENTECTESAKSNDFLETKLWYNNNNASSSEINLNSEPYQYNGSPIITDVTVNNETVTIIEF